MSSASDHLQQHYVTSPSHAMTSLVFEERLCRAPGFRYKVTNIPGVCRHNVASRCRVGRSQCDVSSQTGLDDATADDEDGDDGGFGPEYEDRMCELIDRQLELGTGDKVCVVGDSRWGARRIAELMKERYCIVDPIVLIDTSSSPVLSTSSVDSEAETSTTNVVEPSPNQVS